MGLSRAEKCWDSVGRTMEEAEIHNMTTFTSFVSVKRQRRIDMIIKWILQVRMVTCLVASTWTVRHASHGTKDAGQICTKDQQNFVSREDLRN